MKVAISTASEYSNSLVTAMTANGIDSVTLCNWGSRDRLEKLLEVSKSDLIHFQWPEALLSTQERYEGSTASLLEIARMLRRIRRNTPIVLTYHNLLPHENINTQFEIELYRLFNEHASLILHHSWSGKDKVSKFHSIPSSIRQAVVRHPPYYFISDYALTRSEVRTKYQIPHDKTVLLSIGNIHPYKRIDSFLNQIANWNLNACALLIAGANCDNTYTRELSDSVTKLTSRGLWARMITRWLSNQEIAELVIACDALICFNDQSSISSGIPHLAEAAGKAVVSSESLYLSEISNDYTLFLVNKDLAHLADRVRESTIKSLSIRAREVGEEWRPAHAGLKLRELYSLAVNLR